MIDTNKYFTEDFKGFDFKLGDKKFRYRVSNPNELQKINLILQIFLRSS